jgi:demethylmenaquinone methyltransferase / 2-methoxy-6-polyprenyl-1,4-benzoquinol methylase
MGGPDSPANREFTLFWTTFAATMTKYTHDTVVPFKDSALGKKEQVAAMFDHIAFRYDLLNRCLSGGIDIFWRKKAIRQLLPYHPKAVLDVATGTADMAILMTRYLSAAHITGIDISAGMLEIGKRKIARLKLDDRVELHKGDSEHIHFPDNSFDAVTVAFGIRNFENLEKGLGEMLRVLRPGGRLLVLEFSQPKQTAFRRLYNFYMRVVASPVGRWLSRNREAYQYLDESVRVFPEGQALLDILGKSGYKDTGLQPLSMGICTIYEGTKILL